MILLEAKAHHGREFLLQAQNVLHVRGRGILLEANAHYVHGREFLLQARVLNARVHEF